MYIHNDRYAGVAVGFTLWRLILRMKRTQLLFFLLFCQFENDYHLGDPTSSLFIGIELHCDQCH